MSELADTPKPSYWAVIFASVRTDADAEHYSQTADEMMALAAEQPGYLGIESVHDAATGAGITVSSSSSSYDDCPAGIVSPAILKAGKSSKTQPFFSVS